MIKDEDGDIISKIIIGNILNNTNKNNAIEKEKNIELSLKYKVLSEYTSLFAKIENENALIDIEKLKLIEQNYNEESENYIQEEYELNSQISDNDSEPIEYDEKTSKKLPKKKKNCNKKSDIIELEEETPSEDNDSEHTEYDEKRSKKRPKKKKYNMKKNDVIELEEETPSKDNDSMSIEEKPIIHRKPKMRKIINEDEESGEGKEIKIFDFKKMILTQNVISGNWTLNTQN